MRHRSRRMTRRTTISIATLALTAACTNGAASEPVPDPGPGTPAPSPSSTGSASPGGTGDRSGDAVDPSRLILSGVRVVERAGGNRIVMRFTGRGTPGWVANYVAEPIQDGSGEPARLDGDTYLDIYATDTTRGVRDGVPRRPSLPGGPVADLYVVGFFEGYTQVLVGIDGERAPYRVRARANPSRLVIDVLD